MNWLILKKLLDTVGIPGQEHLVHDYIESALENDNYEIKRTPLNALVFKDKSNKKKRIAICSHTDEVGFFIRKITKEGFAQVYALGGITTHAAYGSELRFINSKGKTIYGAFVQPSMHELKVLNPPRRRRDLISIQGDIYNTFFERKTHLVDFGFTSKKEAEDNGIRVGCQGTFSTKAKKIGKNRILSKAIDNRVGTYLNLMAANLGIKNPDFAVDHIFGVREEIGAVATTTALFEDDYAAAIVLDVSPAREEAYVGKGPLNRIKDALHIASPVFLKFLEQKAKENNLKLQPYISLGGTDAGKISTFKSGIPTLQVSMVAKSLHTGVSICSIKDIDETQVLLNSVANTFSEKVLKKYKKN